MEISQEIKNLKGLRKTERDTAIKDISNNFYSFLKTAQYSRFNKSLLVSFIPQEFNLRTQQRIIKDILNFLVSGNKIKEVIENKPFYYLENKPLCSMDKGSYSEMMKSNGYKIAYYKFEFDENKRIPIKKKIGVSNINEDVSFNYDLSEPISHKSRDKQGVYINSSLSVVKRTHYRKVVLYSVN